MRLGAFVLVFLLGLALGFAAPVFAPRYVKPYLPELIQGQKELIEGTVVKKEREAERLLLTISTLKGAILATFTHKVPEIDLLVEEGDDVTFKMNGYEPFVTNPIIAKVSKPNAQSEVKEGTMMAPRVDQQKDIDQPLSVE